MSWYIILDALVLFKERGQFRASIKKQTIRCNYSHSLETPKKLIKKEGK